MKLPINYGKNKNLEEVGLTTHGACMMDVFVDANGNTNRKPGYTEICDLGTGAGVDGLFWWGRQNKVIAVSGTRCFQITSSDGTYTEITGDAFESSTRVRFADFGTALYAANGGHIMKIGTGSTVESMYDDYDTDSPENVTHVTILDQYLLGNEVDSERFWWADVGTPDVWTGSTASVEYRPDYLMAMLSVNKELQMMGKTTLETWYNNGTTFASLTQAHVESGTIAVYSFVYVKDRLMWIDNERSVVFLRGRMPTQFSKTLDKYLQTFRTVHDAEGDYLLVGGKSFYVLQFPTEGKTIICDIELGFWYEWGYWINSEYKRWIGNCSCFAQDWNKTLIGDRSSGKIYTIANDDSDDNGSDIRWMVRTPQVDYGTEAERKFATKLTLHFKKTEETDTVTTPEVLVKWRDNGETTWKGHKTITLNPIGKTSFRGQITRLGSYYSRQYEFSAGSGFPAMALISAEEEV